MDIQVIRTRRKQLKRMIEDNTELEKNCLDILINHRDLTTDQIRHVAKRLNIARLNVDIAKLELQSLLYSLDWNENAI